jgi:hypothetical protein
MALLDQDSQSWTAVARLFKSFDVSKGGSGALTLPQLARGLKHFGAFSTPLPNSPTKPPTTTTTTTKALLGAATTSLDESAGSPRSFSVAELLALWTDLDADGNGVVTLPEFSAAVDQRRRLRAPAPDERHARAISTLAAVGRSRGGGPARAGELPGAAAGPPHDTKRPTVRAVAPKPPPAVAPFGPAGGRAVGAGGGAGGGAGDPTGKLHRLAARRASDATARGRASALPPKSGGGGGGPVLRPRTASASPQRSAAKLENVREGGGLRYGVCFWTLRENVS